MCPAFGTRFEFLDLIPKLQEEARHGARLYSVDETLRGFMGARSSLALAVDIRGTSSLVRRTWYLCTIEHPCPLVFS